MSSPPGGVWLGTLCRGPPGGFFFGYAAAPAARRCTVIFWNRCALRRKLSNGCVRRYGVFWKLYYIYIRGHIVYADLSA